MTDPIDDPDFLDALTAALYRTERRDNSELMLMVNRARAYCSSRSMGTFADKARRDVFALWHEHETPPPRLWRRDRRVWVRDDTPERRASLFGRAGAA